MAGKLLGTLDEPRINNKTLQAWVDLVVRKPLRLWSVK